MTPPPVPRAAPPLCDAIPRHCTRCDYDLAGLPEGAACPECGATVDRTFVVLRGHAVGGSATPNSTTAGRALLLIVGTSAIQLFNVIPSLLRGVRAGDGWAVAFHVAMIAIFVAAVGIGLWRRFGDDGPPGQLWLGPGGYLIRGRNDTERRTAYARSPRGRWRWAITGAALVGAAVAFVVLGSQPAPLATLALLPMFVIVLVVATIWSNRRAAARAPTTAVVDSPERQLTLTAWHRDTLVTIQAVARKPALREIRIEVFNGPPDRRRSVRVERFLTPLTDGQAHELIESLRPWLLAAS